MAGFVVTLEPIFFVMEPSQLEQTQVQQIIATGNILDTSAAVPAGSDTSKIQDFEILTVIYEIIRSVERDPVDNASKQKESQDCSQKILELQKRLESARGIIRQLPGIEYSKEEQLRRLESLRHQLALKQQLIKKYKNVQF